MPSIHAIASSIEENGASTVGAAIAGMMKTGMKRSCRKQGIGSRISGG
jgi:hypothetical protein